MTAHILSPHLDDAVLSMGQTIAAMTDDVEIVTVFAGVPAGDVWTRYDQVTGFPDSHRAMLQRRAEDRAAIGKLGPHTRVKHWDYFDYQYDHLPREITNLRMDIRTLFEDGPVYAPLGIGHPDHRLLGEVAREACPLRIGKTLIGVYVYEELPYRVLHPEEVDAAFVMIGAEGWDVGPSPMPLPQGELARITPNGLHGDGPVVAKKYAVGQYRSQFPHGADDPCVWVPERVWNIWKEAT